MRLLCALPFVLAACAGSRAAPPAPPPERPAAPAAPAPASLELPYSSVVFALLEGAPRITLDGDRVLLDGVAVDDVAPIVAAGKLRRVDGLFVALKRRDAEWKQTHPGHERRGAVLLALPPSTKGFMVKSLVETAGFAGFPTTELVISTGGDRPHEGGLYVDAHLPRVPPLHPAVEGDPVLHVYLEPTRFELVWRGGGGELEHTTIERRGDGTDFKELGLRIESSWQARGVHRAADDPAWDQLQLHTGNDLPYTEIIAAIDAAYAPVRPPEGGDGAVPVLAFDVTLSVN